MFTIFSILIKTCKFQRSLEVSRENSYERDEYHIHGDTDPLYYNSQPRTNR